jgi:hypothetical protein
MARQQQQREEERAPMGAAQRRLRAVSGHLQPPTESGGVDLAANPTAGEYAHGTYDRSIDRLFVCTTTCYLLVMWYAFVILSIPCMIDAAIWILGLDCVGPTGRAHRSSVKWIKWRITSATTPKFPILKL